MTPITGARKLRLGHRLLIAVAAVGIMFVAGAIWLQPRLSAAIERARQKANLTLHDQTASVLTLIRSWPDPEVPLMSRIAKLQQRSGWGEVPLYAWGSRTKDAVAAPASDGPSSLDLPSNAVAYRAGDFVFTYPGVVLDRAGPTLWLVILCYDPASNDACWPNSLVFVGQADGLVRRFPADTLSAELTTQNTLRSAHGLQPLPDLCAVQLGKPVVAD